MEEVRKCSVCKLDKPIENFRPTTSKANKYQYRDKTCKLCRSLMAKQKLEADPVYRERRNGATKKWRQDNPEKMPAWRQSDKLSKAHQFYNYFLDHPCVHCGETDPLKLEVDHIEPLKNRKAKKERAAWYKLLVQLQEDKGLQVLCANCHAVKTHKENNTSRWQVACAYVAYEAERGSSST